ncbi:MAG TPA: hypothetical protein PLY93_10900, partial [Turneriella sp.]|nr:hypothetical protein [Turneriella sp.]
VTGKGFIYESQLSHYWGGSGEDSWSEGSNSTNFKTQAIPAGKYSVFLMGATNIGVLQFKQLLSRFGSRVVLNIATRPSTPLAGGGALQNANPTQKPTMNQATNPLGFVAGDAKTKTGSLLPLAFPGKEEAPKLNLRMLAVRDVLDTGQNFWLFLFLFLGVGYYHIRYKMKEKKRLADDGDDSDDDDDE